MSLDRIFLETLPTRLRRKTPPRLKVNVSSIPLLIFITYLLIVSAYLVYTIYHQMTHSHQSVHVRVAGDPDQPILYQSAPTNDKEGVIGGDDEYEVSDVEDDNLEKHKEAPDKMSFVPSWLSSFTAEGPWREMDSVEETVTFDDEQGSFRDTPTLQLQHGDVSLDKAWTKDVTEPLLLSKLFQNALKPNQIHPYYFRMTPPPDENDLTITTMITVDKFTVFDYLVEEYKGPISVACHVLDDESLGYHLSLLDSLYQSNPLIQSNVDLHLIIDRYPRQFNFWRNVARFFSRTNYLFMVDVDFKLCTAAHLRETLFMQGVLREWMMDPRQHPAPPPSPPPANTSSPNNDDAPKEEETRRRRSKAVGLVVPAFEFTTLRYHDMVEVYPTSKDKIQALASYRKVDKFHTQWERGHGPTNYSHWFEATDIYPVTEYNFDYEPYVIMRKDQIPWCDERFIGYGVNKAACLFEIFLSGVDFWVLPNDFIVHQWHPYPSRKRNMERSVNRDFYTVFRQELCFREKMKNVPWNQLDEVRQSLLEEACRELDEKRTPIIDPSAFLPPNQQPNNVAALPITKKKKNKKKKTILT